MKKCKLIYFLLFLSSFNYACATSQKQPKSWPQKMINFFKIRSTKSPAETSTTSPESNPEIEIPKPKKIFKAPGRFFISEETQKFISSLMERLNNLQEQANKTLGKVDPFIEKANNGIQKAEPALNNTKKFMHKAHETLHIWAPILSISTLVVLFLAGGLIVKKLFLT